MCDACDRGISSDNPVQYQQWIDQQDTEIREAIRQRGWYWAGVEGDDATSRPPFAYTIGLTGVDHPELVVFGLHHEISHKVLRGLANRVLSGERFDEDTDLELPIWTTHLHVLRVRMLTCPRPEDVLLWAVDTYAPEVLVAAVQVVWSDSNDRFPWEPGYEFAAWMQPMPGTFSARLPGPAA